METLTTPETTTFTSAGLDFTYTINNGGYVARCYQKLKSGRLKCLFAYKFKTELERSDYVNKYIGKAEEHLQRVALQKQALRVAKSFTENPFQIGDIFINSWGWEQTNVDFYQVIHVKAKSVIIQQIKSEIIKHSETSMAGKVIPVKDHFTNADTFNKMVSVAVYDGKTEYYLKFSYGHAKKHIEGKEYYCSWYA